MAVLVTAVAAAHCRWRLLSVAPCRAEQRSRSAAARASAPPRTAPPAEQHPELALPSDAAAALKATAASSLRRHTMQSPRFMLPLLVSLLVALLNLMLPAGGAPVQAGPDGGLGPWLQVTASAPWSARANFFSAELAAPSGIPSASRVLVAGGRDASGMKNDVWVMDANGAWTQWQDAPWSPRAGGCAVAWNGGVLVMGGSTSTGSYSGVDHVWLLTSGGSWTGYPNAGWNGRVGHACTTTNNGRVFVAGGFVAGSAFQDDVWYSAAPQNGGSWIRATNNAAWSARSGMCLTAQGNNLFFAFGDTGFYTYSAAHGDDATMDLEEMTAKVAAGGSSAHGRNRARSRTAHTFSAAAAGAAVDLAAPDATAALLSPRSVTMAPQAYPTSTSFADVFKSSDFGGSWSAQSAPTSAAGLPSWVTRSYAQAVFWNNRHVYFSGILPGAGALAEMWQYDSTNRWWYTDYSSDLPQLARSSGALVVFQNQLILLGGKEWTSGSATGRLNDVWLMWNPTTPVNARPPLPATEASAPRAQVSSVALFAVSALDYSVSTTALGLQQQFAPFDLGPYTTTTTPLPLATAAVMVRVVLGAGTPSDAVRLLLDGVEVVSSVGNNTMLGPFALVAGGGTATRLSISSSADGDYLFDLPRAGQDVQSLSLACLRADQAPEDAMTIFLPSPSFGPGNMSYTLFVPAAFDRCGLGATYSTPSSLVFSAPALGYSTGAPASGQYTTAISLIPAGATRLLRASSTVDGVYELRVSRGAWSVATVELRGGQGGAGMDSPAAITMDPVFASGVFTYTSQVDFIVRGVRVRAEFASASGDTANFSFNGGPPSALASSSWSGPGAMMLPVGSNTLLVSSEVDGVVYSFEIVRAAPDVSAIAIQGGAGVGGESSMLDVSIAAFDPLSSMAYAIEVPAWVARCSVIVQYGTAGSVTLLPPGGGAGEPAASSGSPSSPSHLALPSGLGVGNSSTTILQVVSTRDGSYQLNVTRRGWDVRGLRVVVSPAPGAEEAVSEPLEVALTPKFSIGFAGPYRVSVAYVYSTLHFFAASFSLEGSVNLTMATSSSSGTNMAFVVSSGQEVFEGIHLPVGAATNLTAASSNDGAYRVQLTRREQDVRSFALRCYTAGGTAPIDVASVPAFAPDLMEYSFSVAPQFASCSVIVSFGTAGSVTLRGNSSSTEAATSGLASVTRFPLQLGQANNISALSTEDGIYTLHIERRNWDVTSLELTGLPAAFSVSAAPTLLRPAQQPLALELTPLFQPGFLGPYAANVSYRISSLLARTNFSLATTVALSFDGAPLAASAVTGASYASELPVGRAVLLRVESSEDGAYDLWVTRHAPDVRDIALACFPATAETDFLAMEIVSLPSFVPGVMQLNFSVPPRLSKCNVVASFDTPSSLELLPVWWPSFPLSAVEELYSDWPSISRVSMLPSSNNNSVVLFSRQDGLYTLNIERRAWDVRALELTALPLAAVDPAADPTFLAAAEQPLTLELTPPFQPGFLGPYALNVSYRFSSLQLRANFSQAPSVALSFDNMTLAAAALSGTSYSTGLLGASGLLPVAREVDVVLESSEDGAYELWVRRDPQVVQGFELTCFPGEDGAEEMPLLVVSSPLFEADRMEYAFSVAAKYAECAIAVTFTDEAGSILLRARGEEVSNFSIVASASGVPSPARVALPLNRTTVVDVFSTADGLYALSLTRRASDVFLITLSGYTDGGADIEVASTPTFIAGVMEYSFSVAAQFASCSVVVSFNTVGSVTLRGNSSSTEAATSGVASTTHFPLQLGEANNTVTVLSTEDGLYTLLIERRDWDVASLELTGVPQAAVDAEADAAFLAMAQQPLALELSPPFQSGFLGLYAANVSYRFSSLLARTNFSLASSVSLAFNGAEFVATAQSGASYSSMDLLGSSGLLPAGGGAVVLRLESSEDGGYEVSVRRAEQAVRGFELVCFPEAEGESVSESATPLQVTSTPLFTTDHMEYSFSVAAQYAECAIAVTYTDEAGSVLLRARGYESNNSSFSIAAAPSTLPSPTHLSLPLNQTTLVDVLSPSDGMYLLRVSRRGWDVRAVLFLSGEGEAGDEQMAGTRGVGRVAVEMNPPKLVPGKRTGYEIRVPWATTALWVRAEFATPGSLRALTRGAASNSSIDVSLESNVTSPVPLLLSPGRNELLLLSTEDGTYLVVVWRESPELVSVEMLNGATGAALTMMLPSFAPGKTFSGADVVYRLGVPLLVSAVRLKVTSALGSSMTKVVNASADLYSSPDALVALPWVELSSSLVSLSPAFALRNGSNVFSLWAAGDGMYRFEIFRSSADVTAVSVAVAPFDPSVEGQGAVEATYPSIGPFVPGQLGPYQARVLPFMYALPRITVAFETAGSVNISFLSSSSSAIASIVASSMVSLAAPALVPLEPLTVRVSSARDGEYSFVLQRAARDVRGFVLRCTVDDARSSVAREGAKMFSFSPSLAALAANNNTMEFAAQVEAPYGLCSLAVTYATPSSLARASLPLGGSQGEQVWVPTGSNVFGPQVALAMGVSILGQVQSNLDGTYVLRVTREECPCTPCPCEPYSPPSWFVPPSGGADTKEADVDNTGTAMPDPDPTKTLVLDERNSWLQIRSCANCTRTLGTNRTSTAALRGVGLEKVRRFFVNNVATPFVIRPSTWSKSENNGPATMDRPVVPAGRMLLADSGSSVSSDPDEPGPWELVFTPPPVLTGGAGYKLLSMLGANASEALYRADLLYYAASACTEPGQWLSDGAGGCLPCPEGALCLGGGRLIPLPGYWSANERSLPAKCAVEEACTGSSVTLLSPDGQHVTAVCAVQYTGPYCAQCAFAYYRLDERCRPCGLSSKERLQVVVLLVVAVAVFVSIAVAIAWLSSKRLATMVAFFLAVQQACALGKSASGTLPQEWVWLPTLYTIVGILNWDVDTLKPGCEVPQLSFTDVYWGTVLVVLVAAVLFLLAALARAAAIAYKEIRVGGDAAPGQAATNVGKDAAGAGERMVGEKAAPTASGTGQGQESVAPLSRCHRLMLVFRSPHRSLLRARFGRRACHAMLILMSMVYLKLSTLSLKGLVCQRAALRVSNGPGVLVGDGRVEGYEELLVADLTTKCWEGSHLLTAVFIAPMLLFGMLGFPLLCVYLLHKAGKDLALSQSKQQQQHEGDKTTAVTPPNDDDGKIKERSEKSSGKAAVSPSSQKSLLPEGLNGSSSSPALQCVTSSSAEVVSSDANADSAASKEQHPLRKRRAPLLSSARQRHFEERETQQSADSCSNIIDSPSQGHGQAKTHDSALGAPVDEKDETALSGTIELASPSMKHTVQDKSAVVIVNAAPSGSTAAKYAVDDRNSGSGDAESATKESNKAAADSKRKSRRKSLVSLALSALTSAAVGSGGPSSAELSAAMNESYGYLCRGLKAQTRTFRCITYPLSLIVAFQSVFGANAAVKLLLPGLAFLAQALVIALWVPFVARYNNVMFGATAVASVLHVIVLLLLMADTSDAAETAEGPTSEYAYGLIGATAAAAVIVVLFWSRKACRRKWNEWKQRKERQVKERNDGISMARITAPAQDGKAAQVVPVSPPSAAVAAGANDSNSSAPQPTVDTASSASSDSSAAPSPTNARVPPPAAVHLHLSEQERRRTRVATMRDVQLGMGIQLTEMDPDVAAETMSPTGGAVGVRGSLRGTLMRPHSHSRRASRRGSISAAGHVSILKGNYPVRFHHGGDSSADHSGNESNDGERNGVCAAGGSESGDESKPAFSAALSDPSTRLRRALTPAMTGQTMRPPLPLHYKVSAANSRRGSIDTGSVPLPFLLDDVNAAAMAVASSAHSSTTAESASSTSPLIAGVASGFSASSSSAPASASAAGLSQSPLLGGAPFKVKDLSSVASRRNSRILLFGELAKALGTPPLAPQQAPCSKDVVAPGAATSAPSMGSAAASRTSSPSLAPMVAAGSPPLIPRRGSLSRPSSLVAAMEVALSELTAPPRAASPSVEPQIPTLEQRASASHSRRASRLSLFVEPNAPLLAPDFLAAQAAPAQAFVKPAPSGPNSGEKERVRVADMSSIASRRNSRAQLFVPPGILSSAPAPAATTSAPVLLSCEGSGSGSQKSSAPGSASTNGASNAHSSSCTALLSSALAAKEAATSASTSEAQSGSASSATASSSSPKSALVAMAARSSGTMHHEAAQMSSSPESALSPSSAPVLVVPATLPTPLPLGSPSMPRAPARLAVPATLSLSAARFHSLSPILASPNAASAAAASSSSSASVSLTIAASPVTPATPAQGMDALALSVAPTPVVADSPAAGSRASGIDPTLLAYATKSPLAGFGSSPNPSPHPSQSPSTSVSSGSNGLATLQLPMTLPSSGIDPALLAYAQRSPMPAPELPVSVSFALADSPTPPAPPAPLVTSSPQHATATARVTSTRASETPLNADHGFSGLASPPSALELLNMPTPAARTLRLQPLPFPPGTARSPAAAAALASAQASGFFSPGRTQLPMKPVLPSRVRVSSAERAAATAALLASATPVPAPSPQSRGSAAGRLPGGLASPASASGSDGSASVGGVPETPAPTANYALGVLPSP